MAKAVVLHHYWNEPGGGELVCSSTAIALKAMGFDPVLASPMKIDVSKYPQWYGISLEDFETYSYPIDLKAFGIYLRLFVGNVGKRAAEKFNAEIVFSDEATSRRALKELRERGIETIEYIHFPLEAAVNEDYRKKGYFYGNDPYILERYGRFPMNLYWWVYKKILPQFTGINPFDASNLVLTNSSWTGNIVREVYGEKPTVLNPPIPPSMEIVERPRDFEEREKSVVMIGRYSEEKRYHWVIEEVLPRLLREDPEIRLYIIGSSGIRSTRAYYERLENLARRAGFSVSRGEDGRATINLITNAPSELKLKIMDRSRVFMHATVNEHWGIAVAEAMARGIPAVIHRSGGAWSDLAEDGRNALGYVDGDEAADAVLRLMNNEGEWRRLSRASVERVKELNLKEYARKLGELLKKI
ncbi:MAG: glycosyltransferase family 4 protein [Fervidicoccaceae archaeon]